MVALAVSATTVAHSAVINFDDISGFTGRQSFPALGIENTYQGFQWPTVGGYQHWAVVNNTENQFSTVGAYSGTQAAWNYNGGPIRDIILSAVNNG
jgi:hypothetical protein